MRVDAGDADIRQVDAELLGEDLRRAGERPVPISTAPLFSATVPSGLILT